MTGEPGCRVVPVPAPGRPGAGAARSPSRAAGNRTTAEQQVQHGSHRVDIARRDQRLTRTASGETKAGVPLTPTFHHRRRQAEAQQHGAAGQVGDECSLGQRRHRPALDPARAPARGGRVGRHRRPARRSACRGARGPRTVSPRRPTPRRATPGRPPRPGRSGDDMEVVEPRQHPALCRSRSSRPGTDSRAGNSSLTATVRFSSAWCARYTAAVDPVATSCSTSYGPNLIPPPVRGASGSEVRGCGSRKAARPASRSASPSSCAPGGRRTRGRRRTPSCRRPPSG